MIISAEERGMIEKSIKRRRVKAFFEGMLYLLPSILLFGTFLFYPLLRTIYLSLFLTGPGGNPARFVGLNNYANLFINPDTAPLFLNSLQVTFLFVVYTVPATIILALFFAVMCNEKLKGIGIFRMIFSSTMGISVAAGSMIWMFLFHPVIGRLNQVLSLFGIDRIYWLTSTEWALISVSISTVWMNLGFTFLILLGGLQTIPVYLYESADIDGCSYFYKLRRVTLPMLSPTLFFVVTISLINSFQTFGQIDMLTSGGPNNATNLIVYSIYQDAFINFRHGPASAQAFILFLIILLLTAIQFKLAERRVHYQ